MPVDSKKEIRAQALRKRRELAAATAAANSALIGAFIAESAMFRESEAVLAYVSAKDNEVNTHGIIQSLLESGKIVYVPVTDMDRREMQWSRLLAMGELEPGRFGLLEPAPACRRFEPVPERALCLVPGVAFTRTGWRIGFGGGFFDRFLAGFAGTSLGLAHGIQVVDRLPIEKHDRPVDYLVTEAGITDCAALRRRELTGA